MRPNVCGDREVVTCFGGDGGALYHLSCDESAPVLPEQCPTAAAPVSEGAGSCPMPMAGTACFLTMHYLQTSEVKGGSWCSGDGLSMPMAGTACLLTMHYLQTSEVKGGSWCSGDGLSMRPNVCGDREVVTCFDG